VDHLEGEARLIGLAAIAKAEGREEGLAAGRGRTSPRAAIGPKGARAATKLEERLSTPIDGPGRSHGSQISKEINS
jgi:hypothetical protein